MFLVNINNILYNINNSKNYIHKNNEENYIVYNNATSFISNHTFDKNKIIITNYARLRIKHNLYQTILQNFPFTYSHTLNNYSILNNFFFYYVNIYTNISAICSQHLNKKNDGRIFGCKGFYETNDMITDKKDFFLTIFSWLNIPKEKIISLNYFNINFINKIYQDEKYIVQQNQKKRKLKKIHKLDPIFIFSVKNHDL